MRLEIRARQYRRARHHRAEEYHDLTLPCEIKSTCSVLAFLIDIPDPIS